MFAQSFVPVSYTVELWQFSHEQKEIWYDGFADRDRDIHLVCAPPDLLVHLSTGALKKKYDWYEASKQTKQKGCFESLRCGILCKKDKFEVLQSVEINLQEHEGSAVCVCLLDRSSEQHVTVISALLCNSSNPSPEARIQSFLRKPVMSKPHDFVIWGGLHEKNRWTHNTSGPMELNNFCPDNVSACPPYAYLFCSDHCLFDSPDITKAISVEAIQPSISVTIQCDRPISLDRQMNSHSRLTQLEGGVAYHVCGVCGVLLSNEILFRCPGQSLESLATTGDTCFKCGKFLNWVEVRQESDECFTCKGWYFHPRQLRVNGTVARYVNKLTIYHEYRDDLLRIALPQFPAEEFKDKGHLLDLLFKEICNVGITGNDLHRLRSNDDPHRSSLESQIQFAGTQFLAEHGNCLEPSLELAPQIEVRFTFLDGTEQEIVVPNYLTVAVCKQQMVPGGLASNMSHLILFLLNGVAFEDSVQLSFFNRNAIEVTLQFVSDDNVVLNSSS